jgi:hypothetical protein
MKLNYLIFNRNFQMNKKLSFIFLVITLFVFSYTHAQINPFYTVTQENVRPIANSNFEVTGVVQAGNPFYLIYPAYTTFLTDGYVLENIPSSKHIQGIQIGFKFPYAGQEFDIFALNAKGYIVLGKSWEGGMTVYADTLIETSTDTVFTNKNKYLISGLYPGKNLDSQGQIYIYIYKGGFEGERRLYVSLISINSPGGNQMLISTNFELKETGEININPYVQYQSFNTNNPIINTYASIMQRYGTDQTHYIYGTGFNSHAWFQTAQSYTNGNYKYGILGDTIMPASVNQKLYTINYLPKASNFMCPVPIRWNPNLGNYKDSAYAANDYEELQGDTLSTTDEIWWYSDMRDSLRFDVYLGTDEISMEKYKIGLMADTMLIKFDYVLGLVNLSLDSLAAGQKYFMKILTIHSSGDTTFCGGYSFYTKEQEHIIKYCRSDEPLFSGLEGAFPVANLDLNTLHFHPDSTDILGVLYYKTVVPDTGSWTTNLQQGQSYLLQLSISSYLDLPATFYIASVFLDYNGDGIFDSPANNNDNHTFGISKTLYKPLTIYIPQNAVPGKTRLRIMVQGYGNNTPFPGPCEKNASIADFIVTIIQAPGCNLSYNDTIIAPSCATYNNGGLEILPQGGTEPYHIQWNTGNNKDTLFTLSGLASPARQRANITDAAGCNIRTSMLQLTQPALLQIDTMLHGSLPWIAFSGGIKPYRAEITGDKTTTLYAVNDTIFLTDLPAGNYHIQATDSNSCNMQEYILTNTALSIVTADAENAFILYPNPATNYIQISGIYNNAVVVIYSMDGKKVFEGNSTNQQRIALPDIASALYFVKVEEDNRRNTFKLIVK